MSGRDDDLEHRLGRRVVLRRGLAGLAAAFAAPAFVGCDDGEGMDGGTDGGPGVDAGPGMDAGAPQFPVRDIPDRPTLRSLIADIGPLQAADANGLRLPAGFTGRVVATSTMVVAGSDYEWHAAPDGGATFLTEDGGWIYTSNSEIPLRGGVGALRFDASGDLVDAYRILDRTNLNCAGGPTPWHTWLSCEEADNGNVHECDPWGEVGAVARPALGTFKHEAVTVDPNRWHLYLTEDQGDGGFYRFIPARMNEAGFPDLTMGELQIAQVDMASGAVTWLTVPDPSFSGDTPTRRQVESTDFDGGEGIWFHEDVVYFSTKGNNRVWAYDVAAESISVLYDDDTSSNPILTGVDNITVSCCGDVLVAEDGGDMEVVAIQPDGEIKALVQVEGHDTSEITGPAFDPGGTRLYFSSQRGSDGDGVTFEITGPFHEPA